FCANKVSPAPEENSDRNASGNSVSSTAAPIAPLVEPRPPTTIMTTTSIDFTKVNEPGLMTGTKWPNSAPATPAKNDETTNACTLYDVVFTPMASAATSSSRMAHNDLPCDDRAMRCAASTVKQTQNQTMNRLLCCGTPLRPSARPKAWGFCTMTRMISPKPSVTMAR